jgi:hypothetical protein
LAKGESLYLRGLIVASYSQIEFLLADISVKLDLKFPYLIKDRFKAAKRIGEREQFAMYKGELDKTCEICVDKKDDGWHHPRGDKH